MGKLHPRTPGKAVQTVLLTVGGQFKGQDIFIIHKFYENIREKEFLSKKKIY